MGLHADGNNSGQCQICAFGKYENGFPLLETMPAKSGRKVSTQSVQTDEDKRDVRSFGSQDRFSNGTEMKYLQKGRKEEEGTEEIYRKDQRDSL